MSSRMLSVAVLPFAAAALALALQTSNVLAQGNYPSRPVRMIVPNAPGSSADITARLIAQPLSERLRQQVVVDNRAGAGTMIGGEAAARSPPDGYTLLMGVITLAINPAMYKKVPYDALRDFAPITQAVSLPGVLLAHRSLPVTSVKELIVLAKARPGEIPFGSSGHGGFSHLSMELFTSMTGSRMLHVPYKGTGPAVTDLLAGHVSLAVVNTLSAVPHIRPGKLRALGVTGTRRVVGLPEVPTIAEAGVPGYESVQWIGLLAPAGTSSEIIARLHKEAVAVLRASEMKERLAQDGAAPVASSPEEFGAFIRSETEKWAKVVRNAGIKPE